MMPLNWFLEALKWRNLMNRVEKLPYIEAYKAVLSGVTMTMFTPNRTGEYLGRHAFLKEPLQVTAFQATILSSVAQIIVTLSAGLLALYYIIPLVPAHSLSDTGNHLWLTALIPVFILAYFFSDGIMKLLSHIPVLQVLTKKYGFIESYSFMSLLNALVLAYTRYLVYAIQFVLVLYVFEVYIPFETALASVAMIFLLQTFVPSVAAFDIGVRGNVALFMLGFFTDNEAQVLGASICVWFVNLVIPALIGYVIIVFRKFVK